MSQLMHPQALCAALEVIINKALSMNLAQPTLPSSLEQKTLTISLHELGFPLCFTCNDNRLLVTSQKNLALDDNHCQIKTSFATLQELKKEQQLTKLIKEDKLDIDGNIKIAQQYAAIAENIEVDWQSELEQHIGDVATYKLSQVLKVIGEKLNFAKQQIQADASEWLVHEKRLVVTHSQLRLFYQAVDDVADDVDALTTRIDALIQASNSNQS